MKTNPNDLMHSFMHGSNTEGNLNGLTKREYFAAMAMQGLLSNHSEKLGPSDLAKWSVKCSDALIFELKKEA